MSKKEKAKEVKVVEVSATEVDDMSKKIKQKEVETEPTSFEFSEVIKPETPPSVELENVEVKPKYILDNITNKPKLKVGDKEIELKEVVLSTDYFFNITGFRYRPSHYRFSNHYNENEMKKVEGEPKWYGAEVNGIQFFLTQGSVVEVKRLDNQTVYSNSNTDGRKPCVKVAYSTIIADNLAIRGFEENGLFNAGLIGGYISIDKVSLSDGKVEIENSIDLTNVSLSVFSITCANSLNVNQFNGGRVSLNGFNSINIYNSSCYCHNDSSFILELSNKKMVNLSIGKTTLSDFKFVNFNHNLCEGLDVNSKIVIDKRIDYGYITGLKPVPFVRVGRSGILVGNQYFTAVEMLGKISTATLHEITPISPWYPTPTFGSPRTLDPLVGRETADKAYNVAFNAGGKGKVPEHQPDQIVVDVVQTTVDQIRSKVKVFALIDTLNPGDVDYDDEYPY